MNGWDNRDAEMKSDLIHARLMSLATPPPPCREDEYLHEWAKRHNADLYAHYQRLDAVNADEWQALGREYVG